MHEVEVRRVLRGDPKIGRKVLDSDGCVVENADEESDLDEDEAYREGHARHRDEESKFVVDEHPKREIDHHLCPRRKCDIRFVSSYPTQRSGEAMETDSSGTRTRFQARARFAR